MRGACLVDEDRVDLVDYRVVEGSPGALRQVAGHVVAQVVESELGVGRVRDVGSVSVGFGRRAQVLQPRIAMGLVEKVRVVDEGAGRPYVDTDAQSEQVVDRPHPAGVTPSEVVVHRDEVHALAGKGVEV